MRSFALVLIFFFGLNASADMVAADCVAFVKAAYAARTGKTMADSDLIDVCTGIIQLLSSEAKVTNSNGTTGTIK